MQPHNRVVDVALKLLLALALTACGAAASPAAAPTSVPQAAEPTSAPPPTAAPAPTIQPPTAAPSTAAPTTVPTAPAPTAAPTTAAGAASATGDLTDEDVLKAFRATFASFPRRMRQTATTKEDNTTTTATAEVESADRMHLTQELNGQQFEAVVISPALYLKTPAGWQQQDDPDALGFFTAVANPAEFLKSTGFEELIAASNRDKPIYKLIGTEQIGNMQTQIYQYEIHSPAINATYTFWLGADSRIYKMESDSERLKSSTVMEFDPSIKVEAPAL